MGKLQGIIRATMGHEGVVNLGGRHHCAHWHRTIGDLLGQVENVGGHTKRFSTGVSPASAQPGDDLVEDQQNIVGVAKRTQSLQVTRGRRDDTRRTRHRLDNNGGDGRGVMQRNQICKLIGKVGTVIGHPPTKSILGQHGVPQVIDL